jgi:hypothetical protein
MKNEKDSTDDMLLHRLDAIPKGRELLGIAKKLRDGVQLSRADKSLLENAKFWHLYPSFIEWRLEFAGLEGRKLLLKISGFRFTTDGERLIALLKPK